MSSPQIAIDSTGNAIVIWIKTYQVAKSGVWGSHFDGEKWAASKQIDANNSAFIHAPQLAINNDNAFVVWQGTDINRISNIWGNRFFKSQWGTAEKIGKETGAALRPQITIDDNGDAFAIWRQVVNNRYRIFTRRFE